MKVIQLNPEINFPKLNPQEEHILAIFYSFHRNNKKCFMNNKTLAEKRGITTRRITHYISQLKVKRLIIVETINHKRNISCTQKAEKFFEGRRMKTSTSNGRKQPSTLEENDYCNIDSTSYSIPNTLEKNKNENKDKINGAHIKID